MAGSCSSSRIGSPSAKGVLHRRRLPSGRRVCFCAAGMTSKHRASMQRPSAKAGACTHAHQAGCAVRRPPDHRRRVAGGDGHVRMGVAGRGPNSGCARSMNVLARWPRGCAACVVHDLARPPLGEAAPCDQTVTARKRPGRAARRGGRGAKDRLSAECRARIVRPGG